MKKSFLKKSEIKNIVVILTDQHALHAISAYTNGICRTPNIDSLCKDGIKFNKAYSPCALCTPARTSLLTGLYPHNHGAIYNSGCHLPFSIKKIGYGLTHITDYLKKSNYNLGYAGKWHLGTAETAADLNFEGFGPKGYGIVRESKEYNNYLKNLNISLPEPVIEFQANQSKGNSSGYLKGSKESSDSFFLVSESKKLIKKFSKDKKPFLSFCSFWGPHAPYWPTEDFKDLYDPKYIEPWESFKDDLNGRPVYHKKYMDTFFPAAKSASWETWSKIISRYWSQVTLIDDAIGDLLQFLKEIKIYDDTLIIFTADHGESIGIHGGMFDKGALAYEEIYNVPMIIKLPNSINKNQVCNEYISTIDLAPTICDILGYSEIDFDGKSLFPLLKNPNIAFRDYWISEFHGHRLPVGQRIIWHKNKKLIINFSDINEFYDLNDDPYELNNLIENIPKNELNIFSEIMSSEMKNTNDRLGPEAYNIFNI